MAARILLKTTREPDALADTRTYVENIAAWLDGRI
jgi:hypothetical protein